MEREGRKFIAMITNSKEKLFLVFIVLFFSIIESFAQCNIETRVINDGLLISHRYEHIEKENVSSWGFSLTSMRFDFEWRSSLEIRLYLISKRKPRNIEPRSIKLLFSNNSEMNLQSKKYRYQKAVEANEFIFNLSEVEAEVLISNDVTKMIIFDDSQSREIELKSPRVFYRQISCILEEIENIGNGNTGNVVNK